MSSAREQSDQNPDELTSPSSFAQLMALERLEDTEVSHASTLGPEKVEIFRSLAAPYPPGAGTRSFGGHVYAQSAYAASKTVGKGFVVHVSITVAMGYQTLKFFFIRKFARLMLACRI
jgi:hypothetical protein